MHLAKFTRSVLLVAGLCFVSGSASAGSFSFTGTFGADDQMEIFSFVAGPGTVIMRTWGYAGGMNAANNLIGAGGFDPILTFFGPDTMLQASTPLLSTNNDGAGVATDLASGLALDSLIDTSNPAVALTPGLTYFLVLTESDNGILGNTYGAGFSEQGNGNFTGSLYPCGGTQFCDFGLDQRNGQWAVDITGVASAVDLSAAAPEPGSFSLLALGASVFMALHRKFSAR